MSLKTTLIGFFLAVIFYGGSCLYAKNMHIGLTTEKVLFNNHHNSVLSYLYLTNLSIQGHKNNPIIYENIQPIDSLNYQSIGLHLKNTGDYITKASKANSLFPIRTLDIISESEDDPYLAIGITLFILPIEFTFGRIWGEYASLFYMGRAGDELIECANYLPKDASLNLKKVGYEFKDYQKYSIISSSIFVGGLAALTYGWISSLNGDYRKDLMVGGGIGVVAGRAFRILPLHSAMKAGAKLELVTGIFPTETQRKLIQDAGTKLQSYVKLTYWGNGIQGLGLLVTSIGIENKDATTVGIGVSTTILSGMIFNILSTKALQKAGNFINHTGVLLSSD